MSVHDKITVNDWTNIKFIKQLEDWSNDVACNADTQTRNMAATEIKTQSGTQKQNKDVRFYSLFPITTIQSDPGSVYSSYESCSPALLIFHVHVAKRKLKKK